ncbi:hypothetical protein BD289DRAFT_365834 [Coniella lustricola]|uniref:Uncharacterized protein n=1 Tax=Coniella lustricola TaxID=2025994 RepID=A0A2T3ABR1_9PEZI|nr:hypothetical protein BD289DRAFT_365834 [Coniella lustricola]
MALSNRDQPDFGLIGKLVQGLAAGVGFVSESVQYQKEQRRQKKRDTGALDPGEATQRDDATQNVAEVDGSPPPKNEDEAAWQLDDMQSELSSEDPPAYEQSHAIGGTLESTETAEASVVDVPQLSVDFISHHPLSTQLSMQVARRLELPVVLTQRRPKARSRGFIRAYAPILEDVGIDQPTFLDFVDKLNKAVEPNPWIQAINLASFAAQHVPEPVTIAVSIACKMVADAAAEAHSRTKTNAFLDNVNDQFFKPRGLVAILMTWKPNDPSMITDVDFNLGSGIRAATISSTSFTTAAAEQSSFSMLKHRMQSSSGSSSFEFPETAALIFPSIDEAASTLAENPEVEAKKQNVLKRGGTFIDDYLDRRAIAKWSDANPDSKMAHQQPKPEFRSRYADPTHPASSGDLVAFVTGGKLSASPSSVLGARMMALQGGRPGGRASPREPPQMRRGAASGGHGGDDQTDGADEQYAERQMVVIPRNGARLGGSGGGLVGGVKKMLQKDVLYLMIVNRPTDEQIAKAGAEYQYV